MTWRCSREDIYCTSSPKLLSALDLIIADFPHRINKIEIEALRHLKLALGRARIRTMSRTMKGLVRPSGCNTYIVRNTVVTRGLPAPEATRGGIKRGDAAGAPTVSVPAVPRPHPTAGAATIAPWSSCAEFRGSLSFSLFVKCPSDTSMPFG